MARKKSKKSILDNYQCEGQMEFDEFFKMSEQIPSTDEFTISVCTGCPKETCYGCMWSPPNVYLRIHKPVIYKAHNHSGIMHHFKSLDNLIKHVRKLKQPFTDWFVTVTYENDVSFIYTLDELVEMR